MFWPIDKKRYENLKSSFTNLNLLVEDLNKSGFSGFLEIKINHDQYYIISRQGFVPKIYVRDKTGKYALASLSVDEIYKKSLAAPAVINVYDVASWKIDLLIGYLSAKPLYTNLSSEFTDFERLTNKLSKDKLTGYLEIKFLDSSFEPYYVLFVQGEIQDIFRGGQSLGKEEALIKGIKQELGSHEAHFNAFQSASAEMKKEPEIERMPPAREVTEERKPPEELKVAMENVSRKTETKQKPSVDRRESREAEKTPPKIEKAKREPEEVEEIEEIDVAPPAVPKAPEVKKEVEKKKTPEKKPKVQPQVSPPTATAEKRVEDLLITPYLGFVEAFLQWVEKSVNQHMGENFFTKTFKKGLLNISDRYPFLDPFLAEFNYVDGKINFSNDDTKAIEFLRGIYTAIDMIFEELTERKRNEIRKTLRQNLRDLERRYHEEIEILRVRTLMPTLFH